MLIPVDDDDIQAMLALEVVKQEMKNRVNMIER